MTTSPNTASNTDFLLAIEDLTVSFDGFKAVNELNLYVDREEIRVIIGPNGAGKTTVLDLICGKTRATSGSIRFHNRELTRLAARSARLGAAILTATNGFLKREGGDTCLFLGFPAFMRMARSMGYDPKPLGKLTGNGDGRFLAFSCGVI